MSNHAQAEVDPEPATAPPPGLALGALVVSLALAWTAGAALQVRHLGWGLLATELGAFALPGLVVLRWGARDGWRGLAVLPSAWQLVVGILAGGMAGLSAAGVGAMVREALGLEAPQTTLSPALGVAVLAAAPVGEELLFRPVLQAGLSRAWRAGTAVTVTACFFGLAHGSAIRFPETFLVGFLTGVVFLKTRSYVLCVLYHAAANAAGLLGWAMSHMTLLLATMMGCALFMVRLLGPPPPLDWPVGRVWWGWNLFGGSRLPGPDRPASPAFNALTWGLLLALSGLVLFSSQFELQQARMARQARDEPALAEETDVWLWRDDGTIAAESEIILAGDRPLPRALPLMLPYPEARIIEVTGPEGPVPWRMVYLDLFEAVLAPEGQPGPTAIRLRVRWELSREALSRDPVHGWRVRLKAFLPVQAYRLDLVLPPESSFAFRGDPDARRKTLFSIENTGGRPRTFFGTCGLGLVRRDGRTERPGTQ